MVEHLKSPTGGVVSTMHQSTQAAQGANAQADQAAEFLGNTVELIATINAMNAQIASAAEEQTSVAEEINRGVHQIARAIDSVANQTQLGVRTVDEMYMIGNRLQSLLGQFKI
ncbi:Methyl-accepting chemotaxis protein PctC [compost metagenome]